MRFLILSDIHGNWEALRAVLAHVRRKRYDRTVFLGDAVGYGGSPNHVVDWLRSLGPPAVAVRGNHDRVCAGLDSADYFNRYARDACLWTLDTLDARNLDYLRQLPQGPLELNPGTIVCHGSSIDEDAYIFSAYDAQGVFSASEAWLAFFGHTHVPSMFSLAADGLRMEMLTGARVVLDLDPESRYLVNPGSVGQPRDHDPRASYALFDEDQRRVFLYRVPYRVGVARRRILQAGLPPVLGDRLLYGA